MKYVRCILCLLCMLLIFAGPSANAAETEQDMSPGTAQQETVPGGGSDSSPGEGSSGEQVQSGPEDPGGSTGTVRAEEPVSSEDADPALMQGNRDGDMPDPAAGIPENRKTPETEDAAEPETEPADRRDPVFGLRLGEEITISMRMQPDDGGGMLRAAASDSVNVKVKIVGEYSYDHAGLGDGTGMLTHKYQVTFNDIKAIAYCLEPAKGNPGESENFTIEKYSDGKSVAKVLYYAQADAAHGGYFALKHPDYSDEKQFIITHMAAAKASGSSSWDLRSNSTAKKEANALIDYVESMPAIIDPEISFSPSGVTASVQGSVIQTGKVTLTGSEGNTAVVTLPAGVTLQNQTSASRSGTGSVTINTGDTFTLTCRLPARSNLAVTVNAVGKQDRDYSAYKIKTDSDAQNLGLIFSEGAAGENRASLTARFTPDVSVIPCKTDCDTGHGLKGAVFGLYAADDMTEADGRVWKKDGRIESVTTGADGKAKFTHALTTGLHYYVKEEKAPAGYLANEEDRMPVSFQMEGSSGTAQTIGQTFENEPVKGEILLRKTDRELSRETESGENGGETGSGEKSGEEAAEENDIPGTKEPPKAQGDATLEGAGYGLYARENILHPDQSGTVLYPAGELVAEALTDERGEILWEDLPLGRYYVKETEPSEGYVLDETEYDAELVYQDQYTPVVRTETAVTEQVMRQGFQIRKLSVRNHTEPLPLAGAGFSAWLVSALEKTGDSYDTSKAEPVVLCEDGSTELFTDEEGKAVSSTLPYGTYLVRETTVPPGHIRAEDFLVHITEHSPDVPQEEVALKDRKIMGKIRIIKTGPMLTGYKKGKFIYKIRGLAGAVFEVTAGEDIFRTDTEGYENGDPVVLYRKGQHVTELTTDSSGEAVSEELLPGKYVVREITAPYGTTLLTKTWETKLKADGEIPVVVNDIGIEDPKQEIEISVVKHSAGSGQTPLRGAEFTLYAGENIYARSEDGKTPGRLLAKTGTPLATAVSGRGGKAVFSLELPNARYYVTETKAPAGYLLNTKRYDCDCSYTDQTKKAIRIRLDIPDEPAGMAAGTAPVTGDRTPLLMLLAAILAAAAAAVICAAVIFYRRTSR